jgi:hypothetical protein
MITVGWLAMSVWRNSDALAVGYLSGDRRQRKMK